MTDQRPLLFLDVDGPLNPWRAEPHRQPDGYTTLRMRPTGWEPPREALRVWLNPGHGPLLLGLGFRIVWATTWKAEANRWIAPVLGLPELPAVEWPQMHHQHPDGVHWKTRHLVASAAGRPFAWVDDEIRPVDRHWIARHHRGEALPHRVDPAKGLLPDDFAVLRDWAAGRTGRAGGGSRWRTD
ncbi:HAD domain-containing protein [Streptomyces sp. NPDC101393]|uniref:HAD domain-containing protein n=1 Tax=Streptomyces sp. NPDC101393 TaxID=3366141 RepID=UPI003825B341